MDELAEYVNDNILSKTNILKYVDDYSIYSFYIGTELELRTKYSSPLRIGDQDPSFSMYYSKYERAKDTIYFKDSSSGKSGTVFDFLQEFLGVHIKVVLMQINSDFGLGLNGEDMGEFKPQLIKSAPLRKEPITIKITKHAKETQRYLDYWNFLEITEATRKRFYSSDVEIIHYITSIEHKSIVATELTIGYEILGQYKIYQPYGDKSFKFRNNFEDILVEGALQLQFKQDFCIITKSIKECMFMYDHFEWEGVAGKSETTPINPYFMTETLQKKYKKVFIWLDNDDAGRQAQAKYMVEYPWLIPVVFDDYVSDSDPTDMFTRAKNLGIKEQALAYIKQLITTKL